MKFLLPVVGLFALSACAPADITKAPISVVPNDASAAVGIDVYARDRSSGNPVPRFRGQDIVQVRTYGQTANGRGEIPGAACTLDSGLYKAQFNTPANVSVPDYGPNSPAIFVTCEGTQNRTGTLTMPIGNKTASDRNASAAGTGLLGAIVIGAVNAAKVNPETDDYAYPMMAVQLK